MSSHPANARVTAAASVDLASGAAVVLDSVRDLLRIADDPGTTDAGDLRGIADGLLEPVARILRLLASSPAGGPTDAPR
jgi:hypothetical protein